MRTDKIYLAARLFPYSYFFYYYYPFFEWNRPNVEMMVITFLLLLDYHVWDLLFFFRSCET